MWPFRKRQAVPEVSGDRERIDDLEDAVKHLNRRFTRLQQQVTRWAEAYDEYISEDDGDDESDSAADLIDEIRKRRSS